jgi:hypothetical protein
MFGIRTDGLVCQLRETCAAVNGPRFLDFIERTLCPRLHPGDIVVMDNLFISPEPLAPQHSTVPALNTALRVDR